MRIGTAEAESTFLSQGQALKVIFEEGGLGPVDVLETPVASTRNAERLQAGDLDFGFIASNWLGRARAGLDPFEQPADLRIVAPMNAGPMFFIARADSDLSWVRDLKGKRIAVGPRSGGTAQHARSLLGALGIGQDAYEEIYLDFAEGARAVERGEVDAQLQRPIPNKQTLELDARTDLRVLDYFGDDLDRALYAHPIYRRVVMPTGALRALKRGSAQAGVLNVLVAHARTDPEMVRRVATLCLGAADRLAVLNPLFAGLAGLFDYIACEGRGAIEFDGVLLHEGALRAYRDAGLF